MTRVGQLFEDEKMEAVDKGIDNDRLNSIKNLMKNLGLTSEKAMESMGIPAEKRATYAATLKEA